MRTEENLDLGSAKEQRVTYPEHIVKKHSVGCSDRLVRREKELLNSNLSFFSLERLQWRIGKVADAEFEAMTRYSLGRKHCLLLVCRYLVI